MFSTVYSRCQQVNMEEKKGQEFVPQVVADDLFIFE